MKRHECADCGLICDCYADNEEDCGWCDDCNGFDDDDFDDFLDGDEGVTDDIYDDL